MPTWPGIKRRPLRGSLDLCAVLDQDALREGFPGRIRLDRGDRIRVGLADKAGEGRDYSSAVCQKS